MKANNNTKVKTATRKAGYQVGRTPAGAKKGKRTPPVMPGAAEGERLPLDWRVDGGGAEPRMWG